MREVDATEVTRLVSTLYQNANFYLPDDVVAALKAALAAEESPPGREVLETLIENAKLAAKNRVPLCQDTGIAAVFIKLGRDVHISGGSLSGAVDAGIAAAQKEGRLRASVVAGSCFDRRNTGDNTPAVTHVEMIEGGAVQVTVLPKGAGSENMSRVAMLKPSDGVRGLVDFAVETVDLAGANPCPPVFLGVGAGGTMDRAALLAKLALLRPAGISNPDPELAQLEREILDRVNALGIGPGGFGGAVTCLGVAIEEAPCHMASLPVAVNVQCNSFRRAAGSI